MDAGVGRGPTSASTTAGVLREPRLPAGHGPDQRPAHARPPLVRRRARLIKNYIMFTPQPVGLARRHLRRPGHDLGPAGRQGQDPAQRPGHVHAAVPQRRAAQLQPRSTSGSTRA
ncbi:MAG: hypothetical protein M0C28_37805 [Candidatus Moduliflexus flocculans]|nr:hypothetical protein [Candidatus Moduliflexus flocculans]